MDLSHAVAQVAQDNEGVTLKITNRAGDPDLDSNGQQATITVLGEYAEKVKKTQESQSRRMWKQRPGTFDPATLTQKNRIETAAAAVIAWSGMEDQGAPLPCTPENVRMVLAGVPWILRQVEAAIENPSSFFAKESIS